MLKITKAEASKILAAGGIILAVSNSGAIRLWNADMLEAIVDCRKYKFYKG